MLHSSGTKHITCSTSYTKHTHTSKSCVCACVHASTHLIWRIVTSGATPPLQSSVGPLRTMNQKRLLLITNLFTISIPTRIKRIHDINVLYKYAHVLYILKCI